MPNLTPNINLQNYAQQLDELNRRLTPTIKNYLHIHRQQSEHYRGLLLSNTPIKYIEIYGNKLASHTKALQDNLRDKLRQAKQNVEHSASKLETLGPTTTLKRGYAIVTDNSEPFGTLSQTSEYKAKNQHSSQRR